MRQIGLMALLMSAVLLMSASTDLMGQRMMGGGVGITLFKDRNFKGRSITYTTDIPNLDGSGFNDQVSSIRVARGEFWEVCEHADYNGRCVVVSGDESDLRRNDWNDKISSLRQVRGGGGGGGGSSDAYIVLYDQTNYRGRVTNFSGAAPWLDKTARSITVGRGTWQLCEGGNFTGRCVSVSRSIPDLGSIGMSRRVASARPMGWDQPDPTPNWSDWYIVLFSSSNYRGSTRNYNSEQRNINRRVGSITVGKGVWELCTGTNFTGRCQTISQSTPRFGFFGFGGTVRSLRPVGPQPR